jgi:hypothetical protein
MERNGKATTIYCSKVQLVLNISCSSAKHLIKCACSIRMGNQEP